MISVKEKQTKQNTEVLVTGAGGFIGTHVAQALHGSGFQVIGLDRDFSHGDFPWECVEGDLLGPDTQNMLNDNRVDFIVHCAAVLPKQFDGEEAERVGKLNRSIDEYILDLCQRNQSFLIYLSGTSIYGLNLVGVSTEESPVDPAGPYVATKLYTERQIFEKLNLDAVSLRVSAPYGPEQRARTVLKLFIERALRGEDLTYHGSGNRSQDFTYVKDVADAVKCAVRSQVKGIYNIAGGHPVSMRELAELIVRSVPGCRSQVISSGQADPQENFRPEFDISKAKRELGWQPKVDIEMGVKECIESLKHKA